MRSWWVVLLLAVGCGDDDGGTNPDGPGSGIDSRLGGGSDAAEAEPDAGPEPACATLDEASCRRRDDCVTDTCLSCSCTPSFNGCRTPDAAAAVCPEVDCLQPFCCHDQAECEGGGTICSPPGAPFGCGACFLAENTCDGDVDCDPAGTGMVCDPIPCACGGERECAMGCTAEAGCDAGTVCNTTTARCEPQPCAGGCPANFRCEGGTCTRMTCTDDGGCPDGYCVVGSCYDSLGECRAPVP